MIDAILTVKQGLFVLAFQPCFRAEYYLADATIL